MTSKIRSTLFTLTILITLGWALLASYNWIDRSITLSYVASGHDLSILNERSLREILLQEWSGISKEAVTKKLEFVMSVSTEPGFLKVDETGSIWYGQIQFVFDEHGLVDIE